jgi:hypothetical protein
MRMFVKRGPSVLHFHECMSVGLLFSIRIVGGGVQLGSFATSATNRPTAPAPGDYDGKFGGIIIGKGNRSIRRKPVTVPLCTPQIPRDLTRLEPGPPRWQASD